MDRGIESVIDLFNDQLGDLGAVAIDVEGGT